LLPLTTAAATMPAQTATLHVASAGLIPDICHPKHTSSSTYRSHHQQQQQLLLLLLAVRNQHLKHFHMAGSQAYCHQVLSQSLQQQQQQQQWLSPVSPTSPLLAASATPATATLSLPAATYNLFAARVTCQVSAPACLLSHSRLRTMDLASKI
jgi:hypothetical protein